MKPGKERKNDAPGRKDKTAIAQWLLAALPLLACGPPPPPALPTTLPSEPRPEPVALSPAFLTPEQVSEQAEAYLALRLWAETARRTARDDPANFHQTLFSAPDRACVAGHRKLLSSLEQTRLRNSLLRCAGQSAARGRGGDWNAASPAERESRARRAIVNRYRALDPPTLISLTLARERGLEVTVRTDPEFGRFAAGYAGCEADLPAYARNLAAAAGPPLAQAWLEAEAGMRDCVNRANARIFQKEP